MNAPAAPSLPKAPALIAGGLGLVLAVPLLAVLAPLVVTPVTRSGAGYLQGALDERMTAPARARPPPRSGEPRSTWSWTPTTS